MESRQYKGYVGNNTLTVPRRTRHRLIKSMKEQSDVRKVPIVNDQLLDQDMPSLPFQADNDCDPIENEETLPVFRVPMYTNAKISEIESTILVFGFATRHRLTKEATEDLLTLLNHHMPIGSSMPTSTYLLRKKFSPTVSSTVTTHYICDECSSYVGEDENAVCED
ncbi:unnamed protein product [Orchesella dallaii]|uniref:Uncharacterized protein n=1 Tax=Orchesella dallaii TaxID=48710 RepID=A0ABP1QM24_9HEXA